MYCLPASLVLPLTFVIPATYTERTRGFSWDLATAFGTDVWFKLGQFESLVGLRTPGFTKSSVRNTTSQLNPLFGIRQIADAVPTFIPWLSLQLVL